MAIEYKPTKKKEKVAKAPKEPKAPKVEKPIKIGEVKKLKTTKPKKEPKAPKLEKSIKEDKGTLLEIKPKKEKTTKATKEEKIKELGELSFGDVTKEKKKFHFSLKDKKTRIIFISAIAALLAIATILVFVIINNKKGNEPIKIMISENPKLSYYVGDEADYTGLVIAIVKKNGESDYVKYTRENSKDFTITGFDSRVPRDRQDITVIYGGFSCKYTIKIKELPEPVRELVGISIETYPKTEYKVGEWIETEGGWLLKHYSDGTTKRTMLVDSYIDEKSWKDARAGGVGTYTIIVKYKEDGKVFRTTYEITFTE